MYLIKQILDSPDQIETAAKEHPDISCLLEEMPVQNEHEGNKIISFQHMQ